MRLQKFRSACNNNEANRWLFMAVGRWERYGYVASRVMEAAPEPVVNLSGPLQVDARAASNWDEAH
jgi:hypothetical protein